MLDFVTAKEEQVKDHILEQYIGSWSIYFSEYIMQLKSSFWKHILLFFCRNCLRQWIISRGNILPKEEFNIMDMSFVMM